MRIPTPRILPAAIAALSLLLVCKVATLTTNAVDGWRGIGDHAADAGALVRQAHASSADEQVATHAPPMAVVAEPSNPPKADDPDLTKLTRELATKMAKRLSSLDAREKQLDQRASVLDAADTSLRSRFDQLHALSQKLEGLETERQERMQADWAGIVQIYEQMKPKDAAAIFNVLDVHVLLQVLDRMKEKKAAPILAAMQPERARLATQMLAQMRVHRDAAPIPVATAEPPAQPANQP